MGEGSIRVSVKLELQDYWNFSRLYNEEWIYGFLGYFLSVIIGNLIVNDVAGIVFLLISSACGVFFLRSSYKKPFESNKLAQKEAVYNFTENGTEIINVDGSSNSNVRWDEFYGIKQNKDIIFLMTGSSTGYVIPKRQLSTTQFADLETLIKNKLGPKAFIKTSILKYACIGMLVNIITTFLGAVLNNNVQTIDSRHSLMKSIIGLIQVILLVLTFGSGIIFIGQFFRWAYGLFVSKLRISFIKVAISFLAFIFMLLVIGYVDYMIYGVWELHK